MKVMGSLDQCMLGATVHACTVCTYIRTYVVCMYIINSFCGSTVGWCVLSLCCCIHLCLSQSEMEVCSLTSQFEDFVLQLLDRYTTAVVTDRVFSPTSTYYPPPSLSFLFRPLRSLQGASPGSRLAGWSRWLCWIVRWTT